MMTKVFALVLCVIVSVDAGAQDFKESFDAFRAGMQHLQPNSTLQCGKYRIEKVLGQKKGDRRVYI